MVIVVVTMVMVMMMSVLLDISLKYPEGRITKYIRSFVPLMHFFDIRNRRRGRNFVDIAGGAVCLDS
jgi:hypothetical protein